MTQKTRGKEEAKKKAEKKKEEKQREIEKRKQYEALKAEFEGGKKV